MPKQEAVLAEISRDVPEKYKDRPVFVMQVYDCSVFEEYIDGRGFRYTAINNGTGKSELIERRAKPLPNDEDKLTKFILKVRDSRIGGLGRYEVVPGVSLAKLNDILRHIFRIVLPNAKADYIIREEQIALAEELLYSAAARRTLLAEAPTGLGKTLAYLIVGLLIVRSGINKTWSGSFFPGMSTVEWLRMGVLVSTSSIALQKSIRAEVIPELSKIFMDWGIIREPIVAVLRKGKLHYLCEYKLREYLQFERDPETHAELMRIAFDARIIDLAEVDKLPAQVKDKISVPAKCFKNCPNADFCRYRAFRDSTKNRGFDFIICNHQLLLADMKLRAEEESAVLPPFQLLILDEAHKVLPAARSLYGSELSSDAIPAVTKALSELNFTPLTVPVTDGWKTLRDSVNQLSGKLYEAHKRLFSRSEARKSETECDKTLRNIYGFADLLRQHLKATHAFGARRDEQLKHSLIWELKRIAKAANELSDGGGIVRWFETEKGANNAKNGETTALCGIPKDLNERLYADLWKRGIPAMLTSGTLSVGGDFTSLKQSLGLDKGNVRLAEVTHNSPFNYRENCLLYLTENVPDYRDKDYIPKLTDEIERLITASHGHAAVLFTSYRSMRAVHGKLKQRMPDMKDFVLERGSSAAIERFKQSGNGVLFASGSFAEGVDCPGDILSMLIIVKLPFERPSEITRYEQSRYASFGEYMNGVLMPDMLIKLKQNHGRGFRKEGDTCVVAICDYRAANGQPFHEPVIAALPKCGVTGSMDVVTGFYPAKKDVSYFI